MTVDNEVTEQWLRQIAFTTMPIIVLKFSVYVTWDRFQLRNMVIVIAINNYNTTAHTGSYKLEFVSIVSGQG